MRTTGPLVRVGPVFDSGKVVEAVGVDEEGEAGEAVAGRGEEEAQEVCGAFGPAHAAADEGCGEAAGSRLSFDRLRMNGLQQERSGGRVDAAVVVFGERQVDGLGALGGGDGVDALGAGEGGEARAGAHGRLGREPGRADVVAGAGDDEGVAVGALMGVETTCGELGRDQRGGQHFDVDGALFGQAGRYADVEDAKAAGVLGAGEGEQADLGVGECEGYVEVGAGRVDPACVGVQAGRQVEGDEEGCAFGGLRVNGRRPQSLQGQHGVSDGAGQGAGAAGAEDGIDDDTGTAQEAVEGVGVGFGDDVDAVVAGEVELGVVVGATGEEAADDVGTPAAEVAGNDEAVCAVVAGANEDDSAKAGCGAEFVADGPGYGEAGGFHEGV